MKENVQRLLKTFKSGTDRPLLLGAMGLDPFPGLKPVSADEAAIARDGATEKLAFLISYASHVLGQESTYPLSDLGVSLDGAYMDATFAQNDDYYADVAAQIGDNGEKLVLKVWNDIDMMLDIALSQGTSPEDLAEGLASVDFFRSYLGLDS